MSSSTIELKFEGQRILKESRSPCIIDEDDLYQYAIYLGINVLEERNLFWIAAKGLLSSLPSGWLPIEDVKGRIYYYNCEDQSSTWSHPADAECLLLIQRARDDPESVEREKVLFTNYLETQFQDTSPKMSNFQKMLSLPEKRSVQFDLATKTEQISYESESSETDMDDLDNKFGLMDAGSLSPAFIRSPEPEDVNSLLRLTSLEPSSKMPVRSIGNTSSPLPLMDGGGDKRSNFLKPLLPISKLPSQPSAIKNDNSITLISKPAERVRNIDVLMDSSILSHSEVRSSPSSPLPLTLGKLSLNKMTPTITKTPPVLDKFSISEEELKLKVDHEMALIDIRNKFEDEREMEEEKLQQELNIFKMNLKSKLTVEKQNLDSDFNNEVKKIGEDLDNQKKDHLKEIENLKLDLKKNHEEDLKQLRTKLQNEHEIAIKTIEKEFNAKKLVQKTLQDKEITETKKRYTVDFAKMKLDLEKDLQKKTIELKMELEEKTKSLEEYNARMETEAQKEIQNKLEDWKKSEEGKLIQNEASLLETKVMSKTKDLEEINNQILQLIEKKQRLEDETMKLESKIKSTIEPVGRPPESVDNLHNLGNKDEKLEREALLLENDRVPQISGREDIEYLHQKVLRVDSYLQTFNEQLQSLSQIVASRQYESPQIAPGHRFQEMEDSFSSSEGIDSHTFTREPSPYCQPIENEFSDLKNLLKACKRKLRSLERKRFDVHGAEALEIGPTGKHFHFNSSYNSYWNKNMARKNANVHRAQRLLGIHSKPKKLSRLYRDDKESSALAKMAEKLTKKLDREARELSKIEATLRTDHSNVLKPDTNNSNSSLSSSSSSALSDIESPLHFRDTHFGSYQPCIPYTPINVRLKKNQMSYSPILSRDPFSIENKMKQAWTECFADKKIPNGAAFGTNLNQQHLTSELLRTDHAKWMEKIDNMNRRIRQTDSKSKDK